MQIAINARFLTQRITGIQRCARELTREIIEINGTNNTNRIRLLAPKNAPSDFYGVKIYKSGFSENSNLWEQITLPLMVKNEEILWCPCNSGPLLFANQVVTTHDVKVFSQPEDINLYFNWWYRILQPRLANKALKVITVSEFSKKEIVKYLKIPLDKLIAIPNGVSGNLIPAPGDVVAEFKKSKGLPNRFILALSSKFPNKNFARLLEAWQMIFTETGLEDVSLVVAGGYSKAQRVDPLSEVIQNIPRVYNIGYVCDIDLPTLYSAAEAFIFPSIYEGFGLPPLEAMACGTPVVVSNITAIPEVVGDAGVYINPYDVNSIAQGILKIVTDEVLKQKQKEKGLTRAKLFTWREAAEKILSVLEEAYLMRKNIT